MSSQISSMKTANDNTLLATNFLNIANGTLTTVSDCLMRMNDLATQACNGVLSDDARSTLQSEMNALSAQIDQSIAGSNMNGVSTIDRSNMSADLMNKVDVKSLDELKSAGYVACTADNIAVAANKKFYISSVEELQALATATNNGTTPTTSGKTFTLACDIDLSSVCSAESGVSWTAIGASDSSAHRFRGVFDGNGHVVKNLYINSPEDSYQGLFGWIVGAEIKNLGVEDGNVTCGIRSGILVGTTESNSAIKNCYATGNLKQETGDFGAVGILAGQVHQSFVTDCYSEGKIDGIRLTGGLVGYIYSSEVNNCYSNAFVKGIGATGGLAGYAYSESKIYNSYATGNVTATGDNTGGLLGSSSTLTMENCYATGNVVSEGNFAGGLVGLSYNYSSINACYATGNVSGNDYVCGLVSNMYDYSSLSNCYATGNVTGTSNTKAIAINSVSTPITNCYATGFVNGVATDPTGKANFDKSALDSKLWDLSGDNPKLKCCGISANKTSIRMQIGDTSDDRSAITYDAHMGLNLYDLDLSTVESARKTLAKLQSNIEDVTAKQSYIGTQINRLSNIYNSQQIRIENVSAAKSTISDTDYAKEVANMVKSQILQQISISVLTQSQNISGKIALSLL